MVTSVFGMRSVWTLPFIVDFASAFTLRQNSSQAVEPLRVYVHVPKCAGTSFSEALRQASSSLQWWPMDLVASGCGQPMSEGGLNLHCGVEELETCIQSGQACYFEPTVPVLGTACPAPVLASAPRRFVMMIRDPVQRVLSEYYFMKGFMHANFNKAHRTKRSEFFAKKVWTQPVREIAMFGSLMEWVRARENPAHNAITKAIVSGKAGLQAPILRQVVGHVSSCAVFDHDDYLYHWQKYYGFRPGSDVEATINADQHLLSVALDVIETRFDFIGLAEYFDESVSRLSSLLGVSPVATSDGIQTKHSAIGKPDESIIGSDVIEEIRARNKLDTAVYHAVVRGKFWKGSEAADSILAARHDPPERQLTWQTVVAGAREDAVFDPSALLPTTELK